MKSRFGLNTKAGLHGAPIENSQAVPIMSEVGGDANRRLDKNAREKEG